LKWRVVDGYIFLYLTEYDAENPKLTAQCGHDFHLACILEWMERSATCPVCDQVSPTHSLFPILYLDICKDIITNEIFI